MIKITPYDSGCVMYVKPSHIVAITTGNTSELYMGKRSHVTFADGTTVTCIEKADTLAAEVEAQLKADPS